jgi:hypothetical protein
MEETVPEYGRGTASPITKGVDVALFRRRRARPVNAVDPADERHLVAFARSHDGVEAFVEPPTAVLSTTMVLVAGTGEWTRRRVVGSQAACALAQRLGIPVYDATIVGYPQRMRDWTRKRTTDEENRRRGQAGSST